MGEAAYIAFSGEVNATTAEKLPATVSNLTSEGTNTVCGCCRPAAGASRKR